MNSPGNQRIAFIGAGAIGGFVGGHLARAGLDVTLIDQWAEHVDAIKRDGLHFSGTMGEYSVPVRALHIHEAQSLAANPVDIGIVCTKLYDTTWATSLIKQYLAPGGYVVTMQNCVVEELVAGIVGWGRTVGCIASTMSAEAYAPGRIRRTRRAGGSAYTIFRAGETHGRITPRLTGLVAMLNLVDSARATDNLWGERWGKCVANTMTTGMSGITGFNLITVLTDERSRKLVIQLAAEAIRVGRALGFPIEPVRRLEADVWLRAADGERAALAAVDKAIGVELERMTAAAYSGTTQDLRKGRRTEIDYMNGFVADKGDEVGVAAPTHRRITNLVHRMERGELKPHPDHLTTLL